MRGLDWDAHQGSELVTYLLALLLLCTVGTARVTAPTSGIGWGECSSWQSPR